MSERPSKPVLALILPCFNEADVLSETVKRLSAVRADMIRDDLIDSSSFIYFVDDGSKDGTWDQIQSFHKDHSHVKGLKLSRNFGHQNALYAGLSELQDKADIFITMDADLQHDETALPEFVKKYQSGADIVFGVRDSRNTDSFLKKFTALFFYNLMHVMGVKIIKNHADYRLTSAKALKAFLDYPEVNLFLRGLFADLGFKTAEVHFTVKDRFAGDSKYCWYSMFSFAFKGITAFSTAPLRFVTITGFLIFLFSAGMGFYVFASAILTENIAPGWASTVLPIYFLGGIQIICIGILGEYIARIYMEAKNRPRYIKQTELE